MPDDLRRRTNQVLMNQVAMSRYPSPTMMDRIEASIEDRETAAEYVSLLIDRIEQDDYPSMMLFDRVMGLTRILEQSDRDEQ